MGIYSFDSLPPGVYQVMTPAGQYTKAAVPDLVIDVGTELSNVNLAIGPGGTLKGKVSGPAGAVEGATVTAVGSDGIGISSTTTSSGVYTITGLAGDGYTVLASQRVRSGRSRWCRCS